MSLPGVQKQSLSDSIIKDDVDTLQKLLQDKSIQAGLATDGMSWLLIAAEKGTTRIFLTMLLYGDALNYIQNSKPCDIRSVLATVVKRRSETMVDALLKLDCVRSNIDDNKAYDGHIVDEAARANLNNVDDVLVKVETLRKLAGPAQQTELDKLPPEERIFFKIGEEMLAQFMYHLGDDDRRLAQMIDDIFIPFPCVYITPAADAHRSAAPNFVSLAAAAPAISPLRTDERSLTSAAEELAKALRQIYNVANDADDITLPVSRARF